MREILFVAGEVSGDQHAARVASAIRAADSTFVLRGVGGDQLANAGVELIAHTRTLSVMGFIEPIKRLPTFYRLREQLRARFASGNVALVILVDYGGFNLKVAADAKAAGVPVLYFITPQVWASRAGRLADLERTVTKAAVILPFEEALLRKHGIDATFVGHPLLDTAQSMPDRSEARRQLSVGAEDRVLALFPGSRAQEIAQHLDVFVATAELLVARNPSLKVVVSAAPHVEIDAARCPFPVVRSASFALLRAADAAMCKSGTTTLEAAVALCPLVIAYRIDRLSYFLARRIIHIPFIGLVNIVAGREVAKEFVQDALDPIAVAATLEPLLRHESRERKAMVQDLAEVRASLGTPGAAGRVAVMALELARRA